MLLVLLIIVVLTPDIAGKCRDLEALNRQYIGRTLNVYEQQVKRQMVAWYVANCKKRG